MIDISEDVKKAWKWAMHARDYLHGSANADNMLRLADFARDQLARELEHEHRNKCPFTLNMTCKRIHKIDYKREAERLLGEDKAQELNAGEK